MYRLASLRASSSVISSSSRIKIMDVSQRGKASRFGNLEKLGTLGIRREDQSVWERRAPLSPANVKELTSSGLQVLIQPSNRRAYTSAEYAAAGAIEKENLSGAKLILGVKQVPPDALADDKMHCFFSHTIKAQEENMEMLDAVLEKKVRMLDYERLVNDKGQRLVAFGVWAGVAGAINILHGLGLRLLALGHHTPFLHIGPPHNYANAEMAKAAVRNAGYEICLGRMPKSIGPLTFVFTGRGNVSEGARQIFEQLPYEYVEPESLEKAAAHGLTNKVYGCIISKKHYLKRKEGGKFNDDEFSEHPDRYLSNFARDYAPYTSVLINGIFWAPGMPRLISISEAKTILRPPSTPWIKSTPGCPTLPTRLVAICDITADPGGSIQFMQKCTSINRPFCLYDADDHVNTESFSGEGVLVCSIDNMPTQLPREATDFFGSLLMPYIPDIMKAADTHVKFSDIPSSDVIKRAIIASDGELTPDYRYIATMRSQADLKKGSVAALSDKDKRVLLLGAGHVAAPVLEYLCRDKKTHVTLASQYMSDMKGMVEGRDNACPMLLDISQRPDELIKAIKSHDVVISLLPAPFHTKVGQLCIDHNTNMVTASYTSPEMRALANTAGSKGLQFLNEFGLDPGIDHMLAAEAFDNYRESGAKIESFISFCGGLPAPDFSDNPLRYKFSWAPRNVLANMLLPARYLWNGEKIEVQPDGGILNAGLDVEFLPGFSLEAIPNRDSLSYQDEYGLKDAKTILRGTLRYKGFLKSMKALFEIGMIDLNADSRFHPEGPPVTWRALMAEHVGLPNDSLRDTVSSTILEKLGGDQRLLSTIVELGFLDDVEVDKKNTFLDTAAAYLFSKLHLGPNERDVCIMRHEIVAQLMNGQRERKNITLVAWGDSKYSAMARTVGFTTGIATRMLLDGEIDPAQSGLILPTMKTMYPSILKRLESEGITAHEETNIVY